jgi:hypothetical protein
LLTSIRRLTVVNPGFDPRNLLTANVSLPRKPPGDKVAANPT